MPMTGKGKKKAQVPPPPEECFLVHSVIWSESRKQWLADCVKLDSSLNIPETSKTPMGNVLATMLEPWSLDCMSEMITAFEAVYGGNQIYPGQDVESDSDED